MKKLNNRGFTLVEVIAVVVILAVLALLTVPSISSLLNRSEEDSYENLKQSFIIAAEEFVNDNRYNITVSGSSVTKIGDVTVSSGKITIKTLLERGYLSPSGTDSSGNEYIVDPRDKKNTLNVTSSYVKVTFDTSQKTYNFEVTLKWN